MMQTRLAFSYCRLLAYHASGVVLHLKSVTQSLSALYVEIVGDAYMSCSSESVKQPILQLVGYDSPSKLNM